jgi:class 3 adenylate cyclase
VVRCLSCGPSARREERKFVTVLFADLVGFTSRTGASLYISEAEALMAASA